MTTPKEARAIATILDASPYASQCTNAAVDALRDLANQVERLEAQRKELRDAFHELCDYADTSDDSQYGTLATSFVRNIALDALKATE